LSVASAFYLKLTGMYIMQDPRFVIYVAIYLGSKSAKVEKSIVQWIETSPLTYSVTAGHIIVLATVNTVWLFGCFCQKLCIVLSCQKYSHAEILMINLLMPKDTDIILITM